MRVQLLESFVDCVGTVQQLAGYNPRGSTIKRYFFGHREE